MTNFAEINLTEDMRDGWIIECNEAFDNTDQWVPVWETWLMDDAKEADRLEKLYAKRGEEPVMKPIPFLDALELLKKERPLGEDEQWMSYRFLHVETGMIINACILR